MIANFEVGHGCVPAGGCVKLNGQKYCYQIIDRSAGEINLKIAGSV